jgi:protease I
LAADGVERVELEQPRGALYGAGATTELLSIHDGEIQARQHDLVSAGTFPVDKQSATPRWKITMLTADVVRGHRFTSWPSVRTDLRNAGAEVLDEEVVTDGQFTFSRSPADLPAFCAAIIEQFAKA